MIATFGLESTLPISGAPLWPHGIASETRLSFERAVDFWTVLYKNRAMLDKPIGARGVESESTRRAGGRHRLDSARKRGQFLPPYPPFHTASGALQC